jgi:hypothetical protein
MENIGEYNFVVFTFLPGAGILNSNGHPDENGLITVRLFAPRNLIDETMERDELSLVLFTYNRYTGYRYFTMDVSGESLRSIIGLMTISIRMASGNQARPKVEYEHESARDIPVNLNGEYLSPAQVYELIRAQTGCIIDEIGNAALLISGCS